MYSGHARGVEACMQVGIKPGNGRKSNSSSRTLSMRDRGGTVKCKIETRTLHLQIVGMASRCD